jgi:Fe2+ transport system protein FeoA
MLKFKTLVDSNINEVLTISHLEIPDREISQRLLALGIYPKAKIKIISKRNIYILDIRGSRFTIPFDIAKQIFVE